MSRSILLGSALVALAAALFGTLGYITRGAGELGMGSIAFVAWRAALATLLLVVIMSIIAVRGGGGLLNPRRLLSGQRQLGLLVICICGAVLNIAIFAAFLRTTIAVALITFYTFPAIVTVAAVYFYGERLDRTRLAALLLSSAGLLLVVLAPAIEQGELSVDLLGVGLALFAALCQATWMLIAGRGFNPLRSIDVATWVIVGALLLSVVLLIVMGDLAALLLPIDDPRLWFWIVAAGSSGAAIPTVALLAGIGLVGPTRAAILMTLEPVVGVLLAGLLLGEQPGPVQLLGGAGVLAAAVILQLPHRHRPQEQPAAEPEYTHPV